MTQDGVWIAAGIAMAVAIGAGAAEWLRSRRRDLDRVGIVPWGAISLLGFVGAVVAVAVGVRG